ncbi:EAL domain-containing protein [Asticcacaulis sp. BYS171W]|uniref:histidine kinase n=1 Tax=Asticcacaulis aquaticus TaxID=2984212 RepID=A0ABT5HXU1_9CAUL|nr:EAL domain-containing protein [Asticcacaulis aquaticus]MDC7684868.1 EAL domain-containing protein [Asticcacaulis aquaticus]
MIPASSSAPASRHTSIARRLNRLVIACVLFCTLPVAALFVVNEAQRHADNRWSVMKTAAEVLASSVAQGVEARDAGQAFTAIRAVSRTPGINYARVELADGEVLAETGSGARLKTDVVVGADTRHPSLSALLLTRSVQVEAPIVSDGAVIGKVSVVHRAQGLWQSLLLSLAGITALATGALIVALIIARRLQQAMTRPLAELTATVGQIAHTGDFSHPVERRSEDEVGALVDGFNTMLDAISQRDRRIDAQMKGLEADVAERTRDYLVARDEAHAANAAKSEFLATMSHEIRTPMNGVMVMAELLAAESLPPKARRHAQTIAKSGRSLLAVINDILDFSKIEAGKMDVEITEVDLLDLIDDTISLFHAKAREKGLELVAFVQPDAPRIAPADAVRLGQVLSNLVSNALKFTETGHVTIRLLPDRDPGFWRLVVADTGIGIAADKLSGIFGAFTQEDQTTTRRFGGTGLGLSIAKRLVEAMGGGIAVTSEQETIHKRGGTQFHVRLPALADAPSAAPPMLDGHCVHIAVHGRAEAHALRTRFKAAGAVTDGRPALVIADSAARRELNADPRTLVLLADAEDTEADSWLKSGRCAAVLPRPARHRDLDQLIQCLRDGEPLVLSAPETAVWTAGTVYPEARVLVVDDAEVNREVAAESLSRFGIVCVTANDGQAALDCMAAERFDLVLMDGSMPVLDGFEASKRWRAQETQDRTPIVALTAHVVGAAATAWREAGMDAILHKPFTLQALGDILSTFLPPELAQAAPESIATAAYEAPTMANDPTAAFAPSFDGLFDETVFATFLDGRRQGRGEFVDRVLGLYRRHVPEALAALHDALRDKDNDRVASSAHAMKSMSLNLGAKAVATAAAAIENAIRSDGRDATQSEAAALSDALKRTLAALDQRLEGTLPAVAPAVVARDGFTAEETEILRRLEAAMAAGTLEMVYQPIFDRLGETILSAECLIRWPATDTPVISPALFVPLAERSGLIVQLGAYIRRQVLKDAHLFGELPLAINVSPIELDQPDFTSGLTALFEEMGFPPRRFVLEVTETAILGEPEKMKRLFERLRTLGFKLALDDFGVGYSSLTALHRYPFDKIKIDREFVVALDGEARPALEALAIIQAVTGIGRAFGMQVVAEGIETAGQHRHLKSAGVHGLQGYLFSKPLSKGEFAARLKAPVAKAG